MLRRHVKSYAKSSNKIHFKLFTFDGQRIVYPIDSLRNSLPAQREVMSDVFIFENSHEYECYVLVMLDDAGCPLPDSYEYFTLDVFSFIDIDLKELPLHAFDSKTYKLDGLWSTPSHRQSTSHLYKQSSNAGGKMPSMSSSQHSKKSLPMLKPLTVYNPAYSLLVKIRT